MKKKNILLIVIVILIIIVLATGGLYIYMGKSKNLFKYEINHIYESLTNFNSSNLIDIDKTFSINYDMSLETEVLPNYNVVAYLAMDSNNKDLSLKGVVTDEESNHLSAEIILDNNILYITSEELFDKSITYSLEDYDIWEYLDSSDTLSESDYNYLLEFIKDEFLNNLEDSDFTKEYTKIEIDGKEVAVAKHTLSLSSERLTAIYKNMVKSLLSDERSLTILEKVYGEEIDSAEILDDLEDLDLDSTIEVSLYTKKYSYSLVKVVVDTDSLNIEYVNETKELTLYDKDSLETILVRFNDLSEEKINLDIEVEDYTASMVVDLVSKSDSEVVYDFSFAINDVMNLTGTVNIKNTYEGLSPLSQTVDLASISDDDYNTISINLLSNGIITYYIGEDYLEEILISNFEEEISEVAIAAIDVNYGTLADNYTRSDGSFCITINDLIEQSLLDSTYADYEGKVIISNGNYYVTMHNDSYMVNNYNYYSSSSTIKDYVSGYYNYDC